MGQRYSAQEDSKAKRIVGTTVVAFVLAFSRWGTTLGVNPLFISDILIAFILTHMLVTRGIKGSRPRIDGFQGVTYLFAIFFGFIAIRVLLSLGQAGILDWLRDAVPFLYGALAFVSAASLARSSKSDRAATVRVFRWALTIHMLWFSVVALSGNESGFSIAGPFASSPIFQVRPDIDVALVAIAAGLNLRQAILVSSRRFWNIAGIALGVFVVFTTTATRAGQISLLLALALSFAFTYAGSREAKGRQLAMAFATPVILLAVLIGLPTTTAGERLIATIMPDSISGSRAEMNAQGTQQARERTWETVIEWTNDDPLRAAVGSGFGNDFLAQSGTKKFLEGTTYTNVRSPHNWFVGVYARLGAIGIFLASLWMAQLVAIAWRRRQDIGDDDLLAFSTLSIAAIIPVASLGVVLEAPFGAIPFFWSAGVIMASRAGARKPDSSLVMGRHVDITRAAARQHNS
ncbi:O-antigen ligase family protein [Aeromicrobium piscarium]|uniref:O-antigen ligase-related domain-containing protein n=1 Tax=Aeromicrobium piscarium TaxID=2590901 RepID=A0A554RJH1_9ACTN|nr:O-antigen ligase family protein [Aeromicrobium piscarium]TSD54275.1 hypothetical protein FNM00_17650 [Aeromicrobium piscarium]